MDILDRYLACDSGQRQCMDILECYPNICMRQGVSQTNIGRFLGRNREFGSGLEIDCGPSIWWRSFKAKPSVMNNRS